MPDNSENERALQESNYPLLINAIEQSQVVKKLHDDMDKLLKTLPADKYDPRIDPMYDTREFKGY